jgi:hypothetical protein
LRIGWKEYVALPEWGIPRLKAKIDTGARTSAIDAAHYELCTTPQGLHICMSLVVGQRRRRRQVMVEAPVVRLLTVRNSANQPEERPLVETLLQLGPVCKRVQLTVTSRAGMCFRLLLGRKALEGDFLIDVSQKYLLPVPGSG